MSYQHKLKRITTLLLTSILGAFGVAIAEDEPQPASQMIGTYEPNAAYPYGRPNPEAPAQLRQFEFMIGDNVCVDHIRQEDGSWQELNAKWNAAYFMNGYGIQDKYWTDTGFVTSNIRIFDKKINKWMVTFFSMPNYGSGIWQGIKEGENLVMRQPGTRSDGTEYESRLTFFNISDQGFDWVAENVDAGETVQNWKSSCKRVR